MILVTGGAGFIGSNFVLDWLAQCDEPVVNLDALTYAGNTENLASLAGDRRHVFVRGDICDRPLARSPASPSTGRARSSTSRPRATSTAASTGRPSSSAPTSRAPSRCSRPRARTGATLAGARQDGVPLPPRLDRRGLRLARPRRSRLPRIRHLRAEQPVLGEQGGERPPRPRLAPHLRPAGADDQLQQQLRPVPFPGEADPADDRQRPRRQAAAGLRRRPAGARLALRQGPLRARSARCWRAAASARPTTSAAGTRSRTSRSSTPCAACSTS